MEPFLISAMAAAWHRSQDRMEAVAHDLSKLPETENPDYDQLTTFDEALHTVGESEVAWAVLEEIWRTMDLKNIGRVGLFAASPMEDFIDCHGPEYIERIEVKARDDEAFRRMLLGVWPPVNEDRPDWKRIVKLVEGLGPMQSFKP